MVPADAHRFDRLARAANIIVGVSGCFCVLLLLYYFYHYTWTGKRALTSPIGIILYCGLPAVLAAMLFASLRLRPLPRISLALVVVSGATATFIANLFLALLGFSPTKSNRTLWFSESDFADLIKVAKEYNVTFDTRNKLEVIRDLQSRGIDAVPSIPPLELMPLQSDGTRKSVLTLDGTEVLPHGGMSNKVTVYCNESGTHEWYESDEHGFHNPKGVWSAAQMDVVALGDSYTQGHCVTSDTNFVALIRQRYPRTLNLGINGQGSLMTLATLRDYGLSLKPKVVLWFFYEGNDMTDLAEEKKSPLLMRYLQSDFRQPLLQRQTEIDQALEAFIKARIASFRPVEKPPETFSNRVSRSLFLLEELVKLSHLRRKLGLAYGSHRSQEEDLIETSLMDSLEQALREGKKSVESWGGRLYFVYLPDRDRYAGRTSAPDARAHVLHAVRNLGIPLIDIDNAFRPQPDPLALFPFRRLGHYNEAGHRLVAEEVLRTMTVSH